MTETKMKHNKHRVQYYVESVDLICVPLHAQPCTIVAVTRLRFGIVAISFLFRLRQSLQRRNFPECVICLRDRTPGAISYHVISNASFSLSRIHDSLSLCSSSSATISMLIVHTLHVASIYLSIYLSIIYLGLSIWVVWCLNNRLH